jgi:hypothetical protein
MTSHWANVALNLDIISQQYHRRHQLDLIHTEKSPRTTISELKDI